MLNSSSSSGLDAFLQDLERTNIPQDKITQFRQLLKALEQANILPFWFTFSFPFSAIRQSNCRDRLEFLNQSQTVDDLAFVSNQIAMTAEIESLSNQISLATSRASFDVAWNSLLAFASSKVQTALAKDIRTKPFAKIVAVKSMQRLVDALDAAIKSMKSSSLWTTEEKVVKFREMLIRILVY